MLYYGTTCLNSTTILSPSSNAAYVDLVANNQDTIFTNTNITIGVSSQTALSFLRVYYDADKDRVYPFLTAIISVDSGNITGITWDDACIFCGGFAEACEENTYNFDGVPQYQDTAGQQTKSCYLTRDDCSENVKSGGTACDLTLYTVWSGTDANGIALQSQAYRFSRFPAQELSDRLTQAVPTFGLTGRREMTVVEGGVTRFADL